MTAEGWGLRWGDNLPNKLFEREKGERYQVEIQKANPKGHVGAFTSSHNKIVSQRIKPLKLIASEQQHKKVIFLKS